MARAQKRANRQLNPVYANTRNQIAAQRPEINALFDTLLTGLAAQQQASAQDIVQSAANRGVDRPALQGDLTTTLGQALNMAGAQLNRERAGQLSRVGQDVGTVRVGRARATADLADTLTSQDIARQENQLTKTEQQRDFRQNLQEIERSNEISRLSAAQQRARSARGKAQKTLADFSASDIARGLRIDLERVRGADGYVSPEDLAKARATWSKAGLPEKDFWENYQGLWNPNQGTYDQEFQYFRKKYGG